MAQITTSYVKFVRGTPAQWAALTEKDSNTLYFISEKQGTTGLLYLGSKLIAGNESGSISSINDLSDVVISEGITTNSLLVYNGTTAQWENKPISEVLASIVEGMTGATASTAGTAGLVPAPAAGDQNKFLKGDGTWAEVPGATDVSALQATVKTLVGEDSDKSVRAIAAEEVAKIVGDAPEAYDTLTEIANWIQSHPDDVTALNNKITTIEGNVTLLQTTVGDLTASLNTLTSRVDTAETNITELDNRLKWWELEN